MGEKGQPIEKSGEGQAVGAEQSLECAQNLSNASLDASMSACLVGPESRQAAADELKSGMSAFRDASISEAALAKSSELSSILTGGNLTALEQFVKENQDNPDIEKIVAQVNSQVDGHDLNVAWDPIGKRMAVYNVGMTALKSLERPALVVGTNETAVYEREQSGLEKTDRSPNELFSKQSDGLVREVLAETKGINEAAESVRKIGALMKTFDKDGARHIDAAVKLADGILNGRISEVAATLQSKEHSDEEIETIVSYMNELMGTVGMSAEMQHGEIRVGFGATLTDGYMINFSRDAGEQPVAMRRNAGVGTNVVPLVFRPGPEYQLPYADVTVNEALDRMQKQAILAMRRRIF